VWVKRWRCPDCGAVHTCRPRSHWRRFLAPISVILASLGAKLGRLRWPQGESRQRQQYWYHGYLIQSCFHGLPPTEIEILVTERIIVATHSTIDRAIVLWAEPPYRSLAATGPP
jgi:hypothetical protein